MNAVVEVAVTVVVVLLMLDGFRPPVGRVFSWPMYAWAVSAVVSIEVIDRGSAGECARRVNLYDDFPRGEFLIPPDLLDLYLDYLRERNRSVTCVGHLYGPFGEVEVFVGDERVAAGER